MGIDGIRKSSPPAASPASSAESPAESIRSAQLGLSFEVKQAPPATGAVAVEAPRGALAALQAGAVDLNGYLDLKVNEATAHLVGLPVSDLITLRAALRDRLASDPALVDLVRTAAGSVPQLRDDD
jgi:hypothetical protein